MVLEFRMDPIKGSITVMANERALRPNGPKVSCPFCPGAEKATPPAKLVLPNAKEWMVRCFDNAFAIVKPKGKFKAPNPDDYFYSSPAYGEHEVIVETRDHHQLFFDIQNPAHQEMIFHAYKKRMEALWKRKGTKYVHLYKNHGRLAGASIDHEHSQIVSLPFVPPMVRDEIEREAAYKKKTGKCILCEMLKREEGNVLMQNSHFMAICPPFARFPFETWIISKEHVRSLTEFDEMEGGDFIKMLQSVVESVYRVSKDYNVVYHNGVAETDSHFHVELYPRANIWAGLELGTGLIVNTKTEKESLAALGGFKYGNKCELKDGTLKCNPPKK